MFKKLYLEYSDPSKLARLNGKLIVISIIANSLLQIFCIPSLWAMILLLICLANMIAYPLIKHSLLNLVSSFINGVSISIFIYCIIFAEYMNYAGLLFFLIIIGFIIYIPHFFVLQLLWKNLIRPSSRAARWCFLSAILICISFAFYIGNEYKQSLAAIERFKKSNYEVLEKDYFTEKILGMHFIYHTRYEYVDGWRPPIHEPLLVIGMWLNNRVDPLEVDLKKRLELYKKFYPNNQYKFSCSCGMDQSMVYHKDKLWK